MFSENKQEVLLIQKDRLEWQAGKLNGIGGKQEPNDSTSLDTQIREFKEETGIDTKISDWELFCIIDSLDTQIREFKEETGIDTKISDWELFCIIDSTETENKTGTKIGSTYRIYCYKAFNNSLYDARVVETEIPMVLDLFNPEREDHIKYFPILPNVNWLIPMALTTVNQVLQIKYN